MTTREVWLRAARRLFYRQARTLCIALDTIGTDTLATLFATRRARDQLTEHRRVQRNLEGNYYYGDDPSQQPAMARGYGGMYVYPDFATHREARILAALMFAEEAADA